MHHIGAVHTSQRLGESSEIHIAFRSPLRRRIGVRTDRFRPCIMLLSTVVKRGATPFSDSPPATPPCARCRGNKQQHHERCESFMFTPQGTCTAVRKNGKRGMPRKILQRPYTNETSRPCCFALFCARRRQKVHPGLAYRAVRTGKCHIQLDRFQEQKVRRRNNLVDIIISETYNLMLQSSFVVTENLDYFLTARAWVRVSVTVPFYPTHASTCT